MQLKKFSMHDIHGCRLKDVEDWLYFPILNILYKWSNFILLSSFWPVQEMASEAGWGEIQSKLLFVTTLRQPLLYDVVGTCWHRKQRWLFFTDKQALWLRIYSFFLHVPGGGFLFCILKWFFNAIHNSNKCRNTCVMNWSTHREVLGTIQA
jgi:hypothetical protein